MTSIRTKYVGTQRFGETKKVICNDQDVTVMIKVIIGENINNHSTLAIGPLIYH